MAKKKRRPGDRRPKRKTPSTRHPGELTDLPDRRAIETVMRRLVGGMEEENDPSTPRGHALAILDRAFQERSGDKRVTLAQQALTVWPDCADAYVLLAENNPTRKEALRLYEEGVAAAERALGPDAYREAAGHFWGILATRPYMRARLGLALSLWAAGRREEAVRHLQDMLRLNPHDNQGARYTLAAFLASMDRNEDLAQLLEQFPDDGMAHWAYTRALLEFRQHGDTPEARQLLKKAIKVNKHVPMYFLGHKHPPVEPPGYYSPGAESEALQYIGAGLASWKNTPGAIAWVRAQTSAAKEKIQAPAAKGPLALVKNWLQKRLPQEHDVWQADFRQLPDAIRIAGEPVRPWLILVVSQSTDLVLTHEIGEDEPSAALLWDKLVHAMQNPAIGEPHRPIAIQVRPNERWESLRTHFQEVSIDLVVKDDLDRLDAAFGDLIQHLGAKPPHPGLLDVPGVRPELVGGFFEAAAFFFEQAPWRQVGYEAAIKVQCDKFQSGPWYAVVMGQSGLTMGVALYEDLALLRRLWTREASDEENARRTVATTVTFGEETELPLADVEAVRRYGWKVARPDAYPSIFHKDRGMSMRPPLAWELELLSGCLQAIPDFVKRHPQDDPAEDRVAVLVAGGELTLVLSWVIEVSG